MSVERKGMSVGLVWFGIIGVEKEWNLSSVNRILLNGMFVCLVELSLGIRFGLVWHNWG